MGWLLISLHWYIVILLLGIVFLPLSQRIFGRFWDAGYAFAKVLAILFVSYTAFIFGTVRILSFTQTNIIIITGIFALINIVLFKRKKISPASHSLQTILIIILEELLFLASFLFWVYVRGHEPSIHSLEKFMDFGFINSILRSKYFPPADIWYAGKPINYYYFGHLIGALLIKLSGIKPSIGYNLILATIFGLGITEAFALIGSMINITLKKTHLVRTVILAALGSFILNLGGNLHTIYAFTTGYPADKPIPFWQILSGFNPDKYWYPNATRFIPYTIHEFPSYSYVVADLHGHVFDIPFVLLTLALLFLIYISFRANDSEPENHFRLKRSEGFLHSSRFALDSVGMTGNAIFLGFLTAIHYMTNAFDGPIYMLLTIIIFFLFFKFSKRFLALVAILAISFIVFSLPFSYHFEPFVSGIGVNCSPSFLTNIGKIGPFLFEKDKCQISPLWMLFVLWGFFWVSFTLFIATQYLKKQFNSAIMQQCNNFIFLLFSFSTFLIIIPEFFYIKDIYPLHFRANTMFKLGYQAFIMMSIASTYTLFQIKLLDKWKAWLLTLIFIFFLFFVAIYPTFSIPSYYGSLDQPVVLDGELWLKATYPQDYEIVNYLNHHVKGQPVILEAQGDSYTDYERISAFTGLPTVAGWWVHEWLWRGSADVVGNRIPDIVNIYESTDISLTKNLLQKYRVRYVIISLMEKQKYPHLDEAKFSKIGRLVFRSSDGSGAIYQINQ